MNIFDTFISYRRSDCSAEVLNIYDTLQSRGHSVFCDIKSLDSGKFEKKILDTISNCINFLLVLGPQSLSRCVNEDDWLRKEIRTALENNRNIICVFVGNIVFPDNLPDDIKDIANYESIPYSYQYSNAFYEKLESKYLIKTDNFATSNPLTDFLIDDDTLIKYIGTAPIVNIPSSIKRIEPYAFKDKTFILEINFNEGLEEICESAFERCLNVSLITFPSTLKRIGPKAFYRCFKLASVSFNSELEKLDDNAFGFCTKIKLIRLGKNVKYIAPSSFNNCNKLGLINIDEENENYSSQDGILYSKDKSQILRCPEGYSEDVIDVKEGVVKVGDYCFSQCLNLVHIGLPNTLLEVGEYAFNECSNINRLYLGENIKKFALNAVKGWNYTQNIEVSKRFDNLLKYQIQKMIDSNGFKEIDSNENTDKIILIKTTFESIEEAEMMAKMLLDKHYISSGQLKQLRSLYLWNDEFSNEKEIELSCMTLKVFYNVIEEFINEHHSYELCQILSTTVDEFPKPFLEWVQHNTLDHFKVK